MVYEKNQGIRTPFPFVNDGNPVKVVDDDRHVISLQGHVHKEDNKNKQISIVKVGKFQDGSTGKKKMLFIPLEEKDLIANALLKFSVEHE